MRHLTDTNGTSGADGVTVRVLLVTAMSSLLGALAGSIFDGFAPSLLISPAVTGLAATVALGRSRVVWWAVVAATTLASAVVTMLVAGGSPRDAFGIVSGPRRLISTEWPSPSDPVMLGSLGFLLAIGVVAASALVFRRTAHLAPLTPLLVVLVIVVALAAPQRPAWPYLAAIGALTVAFGLTRADAPRSWGVVADRTVAVSLAGLSVGVLVTSAAISWSERADPRRPEDATTSAALLDPIEAVVGLRRADPPVELFWISRAPNDSSVPMPSRWRLTALDAYDGQRWVPQLTLRPIGERLGDAQSGVDRIDVETLILTDDIDVVPFSGPPLSIDTPAETDVDRVVVRLTDRPEPGTTIRTASLVAPRSMQGGVVASRSIDEVAGTFTERAAALAGEGTIDERLRSIERTMRADWRLDSAAPGGGQQLALIERFVTDTQRGTREQFVTAFVLLVRSLGFDARVATGFVVPPEEVTDPLRLVSTSAAVWPEVRVDGVGWVAFDPVPESETTAIDDLPPAPDAQSPAAAQPPIAPPTETSDETDVEDRPVEKTGGGWPVVRRWLIRVGVGVGIGLTPITCAVAAVLAGKWHRRRRRLRSAQPATVVRGAWANTTDSLIDAGLSIAPSWTDDTIAVQASSVAASVPHEARRLAAMATAMTFGPADDAPRLVEDALVMSEAIDAAIRSNRTVWQRFRWRLSLRSILPATRSPVRL